MGVLADIYISRDTEAVGYNANPNLPASDRSQFKGITALELSTLWSIMRSIEWEVSTLREFEYLLQKDGGERVIQRLPVAMVAELARLTAEQIQTIAPKWAATDEMQWPPDSARQVIEEIASLARRAVESGRNVYLWNCV
jgi:hypothetical protein